MGGGIAAGTAMLSEKKRDEALSFVPFVRLGL